MVNLAHTCFNLVELLEADLDCLTGLVVLELPQNEQLTL